MGAEREHIRRELEQEHSRLHRLLKEDVLRTPDGYFEALEARLLQIPNAQQSRSIIRSMRVWIFAAAACMVLALSARVFFFHSHAEQPLHIALAEMEDSELDVYLHEQLESLSYDDLYTYLDNSVQAFEAMDLFETQFADTAAVTALLNDHIQEQVFTDAVNTEEKILEKHMIETTGEDALDAFINSEYILDDIGL